MSAFASKVAAGRRRPRWWIVVLAAVAAMAFAGGVSARAEAAAVQRTPYSGSDQFTDDSCGYPTAVAATFSGRVGVRAGTGPDAGYFFFTNNYSFREVHTDPATGRWFVIRGNGQFKDVKAKPVGGNVFEVTSKNSGQPLVVEDSTGKVVLRFAGVVTYRYTVDADSNTYCRLSGRDPGGSLPRRLGVFGRRIDSRDRLREPAHRPPARGHGVPARLLRIPPARLRIGSQEAAADLPAWLRR